MRIVTLVRNENWYLTTIEQVAKRERILKTLDQLIQQLSDEAKKCRKSMAYFRKIHGEPKNSETYDQLNRIVEDTEQIVKYLKELKRYRDASGFSGKLEKFREQKED